MNGGQNPSDPKRLILSPLGKQAVIRKARACPIVECQINKDWRRDVKDLTQIIVARQHPQGAIIFGSYLVDRACLGLKDTFAEVAPSFEDYREQYLAVMSDATRMGPCTPELAHQIIYQAIDYAAQFGFKPQKDYKASQVILEPRGQFPETESVEFGTNGKPLFIPGPYDNVRAILKQLETKAGPGNYDYLPIDSFGF